MRMVSVDIGSTWTKAALFDLEHDDALTLVNQTLTPTTTHHLADGFFASMNKVLNVADARPLLRSGEVSIIPPPARRAPTISPPRSGSSAVACRPWR